MALHYYFLPVISVAVGELTHRGPKYLLWDQNPGGADARFYMMDYGLIDLAFVVAETTLAQHQQAFDQPDVLSIDPRNGNQRDLDAVVSQAELNALTAYLDTAGNFVPMGWATTADTRRAVLRGICGIFIFMQAITVKAGAPTGWGVTLATTWAELPDDKRAAIRDAAVAMELGTADPRAAATIRQILRAMGNTLSQRPIYLGFAGQL